MSNMADKNYPKRSPLIQLQNSRSAFADWTDVENGTYFPNTGMSAKKETNTFELKKKITLPIQEKTEGNNEVINKLKYSLKDAMEENDQLRNKVEELERLLSAAGEEIEQRDKAIIELANALQVKDSIQKENQSSSLNQKDIGREKPKRNARSID